MSEKQSAKIAREAREVLKRDPRERTLAGAATASEQAREAERAIQEGRALAAAVQTAAGSVTSEEEDERMRQASEPVAPARK